MMDLQMRTSLNTIAYRRSGRVETVVEEELVIFGACGEEVC